MSKKKVGGNTMTLKDFHGGCIPTDLSLPSAPGAIAKPSDGIGYNRPTSWVHPIGRSDHRSGPHSSPATGKFDNRSPFFAQTVFIGRNFDEEERKPLGGEQASRRTIVDGSVELSYGGVELKPEYASGGGLSGRQGNAPVSQSAGVNSYKARVAEGVHSEAYPQNLREKKEHGGGTYPNAWGMKKEATMHGASPVSKLAHASAIEKVSSGMWQSKMVNHQTDVEAARLSEATSASHPSLGGNSNYSTHNRMDVVNGKEHFHAMLARHADRGLKIVDETRDCNPDKERFEAYRYSEIQESTTSYHANGANPAGINGKLSRPEVLHYLPSKPSERPKLKLLPRTRPLENSEPTISNYPQEYLSVKDSVHGELFNEVPGNLDSANPGLDHLESAKQLSHHRKLNLMPRSPHSEQSVGGIVKGRNPLFGGARPRELALKERRVDDVAVNHQNDSVDHSDRAEQNVKTRRVDLASPKHHDDKSGHVHFDQNVKNRRIDLASPKHHGDKSGRGRFDQKIGIETERKESGIVTEGENVQRRNWRSDNRRKNVETGRQQPIERQTSLDTWRKPAEHEQSKPSIHDAVGLHCGKAASAVDLVQTFSRSVSELKTINRSPGGRGLSGRAQVPFSRLVDSTSRSQINGH